MKYTRILILLLILISSFFILQVIKDKETINNISEFTTKSILDLSTKAAIVLADLEIVIDGDSPIIFIDSPKNITYNYNNSINLNFTIVEANQDTIYYNVDNGNNITVTANTTFSVNETLMSHTLTLYANDTLGNLNSSSVTFSINISKGYEVDDDEFEEGETTDFDSINKTQMQNLSNVKIEKLDRGKIEFREALNISKDINISGNVNISFNRIEVITENITELNKSATLRLYNLTFTDPRPLRDGAVCSSSICTENSYIGGVFSFNVTSFTIYSAEETPAAAPSPGAPGGGAGGGRAVSALTDFSVSTNLIKISLSQGETKIEFIEIENTGTAVLNLEINLEGIKDFLIFSGGVSKYTLRLQPGEKQSVQLIFNAPKDYKPGVYPGRIIVKSPITQRIITTIVEVESAKRIFDVDIRIQEKRVVKGTNLITEIIIFNLGELRGRVDTQVEFGVKDVDGNIIQKEETRLAVETQASFTGSILIPRYLEDGRYIFYAIVTFDNQTGTASEVFEVISRPAGFLALSTLYIYIIPGFVSTIIILIILLELKHHYKKKILKEKPSLISEVIPKVKEKFDINKFLRETEREIGHGAHKKILDLKLKVLRQNYELGLISKEEYLKAKRKIEKRL